MAKWPDAGSGQNRRRSVPRYLRQMQVSATQNDINGGADGLGRAQPVDLRYPPGHVNRDPTQGITRRGVIVTATLHVPNPAVSQHPPRSASFAGTASAVYKAIKSAREQDTSCRVAGSNDEVPDR